MDVGEISLNEPYLEELDSEDQLKSVNSMLDNTTIKCLLSSMEENVSLPIMLIKPLKNMDVPTTVTVMARVEDGLKTCIQPEVKLMENALRPKSQQSDKVSDAGGISLTELYQEESDSEDQSISVNNMPNNTTIKCLLSNMGENVLLPIMLIKPTRNMDAPITATAMAWAEDGLKTCIQREEVENALRQNRPLESSKSVWKIT